MRIIGDRPRFIYYSLIAPGEKANIERDQVP